ncbi:hypothetical protein QQ045_000598 [Rhodiola kirilowii]
MEMVSDRPAPNPTDSASDPDSSGFVFHRGIASDPPPRPVKEGVSEDEDDDMFMVPQMEDASQNKPSDMVVKRGRSRNAADREHKKIKRLLRNRVSAQQARERKKVYVTDMEQRARELQESNYRLEEKISTLINENTMLRKVLISSRPTNENADSKH